MVWLNARYRQYEFDNRRRPSTSRSIGRATTRHAAPERSRPTRSASRGTPSTPTPRYSPMPFTGVPRRLHAREHRLHVPVRRPDTEDTGAHLGRPDRPRLADAARRLRAQQADGAADSTRRHPRRRRAAGADASTTSRAGTRDRVSGDRPSSRRCRCSSFNASVGTGKDNYPDNGATINPSTSSSGCSNNDNHAYQAGVDFVPVENKVTLGATYGYEKYTAPSRRRATPGTAALGATAGVLRPARATGATTAPTRSTRPMSSIDLLQDPEVDVRFGYDYSKAESTYDYALAPITTLADAAAAGPVTNNTQRDARRPVSRHPARRLGCAYWYSKYSVNDFRSRRSRTARSTGGQPVAHDARATTTRRTRRKRSWRGVVSLVTRSTSGEPRRSACLSRLTNGPPSAPFVRLFSLPRRAPDVPPQVAEFSPQRGDFPASPHAEKPPA